MDRYDSRAADKAAGAPELTMEMVKAGLSAFDEGMRAGEEAALMVVEIFYRMMAKSALVTLPKSPPPTH